MKHLSAAAEKVMNKLINGLTEECNHKRIDNSNTIFMPVVVEQIGKNYFGNEYSIAHYYEQNGDLMADPEMIFWQGGDGHFYPVYFKQDGAFAIEQISAFVDPDNYKNFKVRLKWQSDHTAFANTWMRNIKQQQGL